MFLKHFVKYILYNTKALFLFLFKNTDFDTDKNKTVFITHSLNGGSENYVKQNDFSDCVFLRKIGYGRDWIFSITEYQKTKYILKNNLFKELAGYNLYFVNSLVSFSEKTDILNFIKKEKENRKINIVYLIHDFDCVCKNNFNLTKDGYYCQLKCQNCKKYNQAYSDIWESFLSECIEIRCFSNSSKKIILQKFDKLNPNRITVIPHNVDYCKNLNPIKLNLKELHIGFVGNCNNIPKGKNIVVPFLRFAKKNKIPISVIGKFNLQNKIFAKNINYVGKYKQNELGKILEEEKVNIIFFTSIWPETFSYLISELIALNVPICAFDIGAQGEKLKKYKFGHFITLGSPSEMFHQINEFCRTLK